MKRSHTRLVVCPRDALTGDVVKTVPLPKDEQGRPREALVLLDLEGQPRAYLNRCRHLPVPIDGGSRRYLTRGGEYLLCGTHGALFRRDDGMCVAGPCLDLALEALELVEEDGTLLLLI